MEKIQPKLDYLMQQDDLIQIYEDHINLKIIMDNSKKYFTIGEIASAHDGDHNEFLNILKTYLDKGLDFIKFQVFII